MMFNKCFGHITNKIQERKYADSMNCFVNKDVSLFVWLTKSVFKNGDRVTRKMCFPIVWQPVTVKQLECLFTSYRLSVKDQYHMFFRVKDQYIVSWLTFRFDHWDPGREWPIHYLLTLAHQLHRLDWILVGCYQSLMKYLKVKVYNMNNKYTN